MNKNRTRIKILLCLIFFTGVIVFVEMKPVFCQTSTNWSIPTEVTDSGGGACNSDNYRLCFSIGQTSAVGVSDSNTQCIAAGFITGVAKKIQDADTSDDASSKSSSTCFINTLSSD